MHPLLLSALLAAHAATLTGVVADRDIYHGERLVGATVWLDDGTTVTTSADGYYTFGGLSTGTYTAHAVADGYLEGSCTKTIESDDTYWCSIALEPDPGGDDTGDPPDDTGDTDTTPDDTAPDDTATPDTGAEGTFPPGAWVPLYGCSATGTVSAAWLGLLAALGVVRRRRRG
jgi:uncharacterized protein (TIGR03382 family)